MRPKRIHKGVIIIGLTEILIGTVTLTGIILSLVLCLSHKPLSVFLFVTVTSLISMSLGIGIIRVSIFAYKLLLYFSVTIILSKILIFSNIITLHGALETNIPDNIKNAISILYHSAIFIYLKQNKIKDYFMGHINE